MSYIKPFEYIPATTAMCDPNNATARELNFNDHKLMVPDYLLDKTLRYYLSFQISAKERVSIKDAYKNALVALMGSKYSDYELSKWLPTAALLPCCKWVLMTSHFDDTDLKWVSSPGNYTCMGFWKCLQEYAAANTPVMPDDPNDRRVKLAEGVIVPSPNEQAKIQASFAKSPNLEAAYIGAGCIDILPTNNKILEILSLALTADPKANFYWTMKPIVIISSVNVPVGTSIYSQISPELTTYLPESNTNSAVKSEVKKILPYAAAVAVILLLLRK